MVLCSLNLELVAPKEGLVITESSIEDFKGAICAAKTEVEVRHWRHQVNDQGRLDSQPSKRGGFTTLFKFFDFL